MADDVLLAGLVTDDRPIERRTFENQRLLGPAVLLPLDDVSFDNNTWEIEDGDVEALLIEMPAGRTVSGVIALREVTFRNCVFHNVAVMGTKASLKTFRAGFAEAKKKRQLSGVSSSPA